MVAAAMESGGRPGRVQCSATTAALIRTQSNDLAVHPGPAQPCPAPALAPSNTSRHPPPLPQASDSSRARRREQCAGRGGRGPVPDGFLLGPQRPPRQWRRLGPHVVVPADRQLVGSDVPAAAISHVAEAGVGLGIHWLGSAAAGQVLRRGAALAPKAGGGPVRGSRGSRCEAPFFKLRVRVSVCLSCCGGCGVLRQLIGLAAAAAAAAAAASPRRLDVWC